MGILTLSIVERCFEAFQATGLLKTLSPVAMRRMLRFESPGLSPRHRAICC